MKFVLSDSSVNRYGYRVLTSGIDLDAFKKNPVMFYNHERYGVLPIGKWTNIQVEGDQLTAEPHFDENDELAMKVKDKVEQGILNSASIGFYVLAIDESPEMLLAGQTRPTVSKSEVFEASIADVPGNRNALKLSFTSGLQLSGTLPEEHLNGVLPLIKPKKRMENIAKELGLAVDATEEQILAALKKSKGAEQPAANPLVDQLVALGKANGVITEKNEAQYRKLAAADFDSTLELVKEKAAATLSVGTAHEEEKGKEGTEHLSLVDAIKQLAGAGGNTTNADDRSKWTLNEWRKKDPKGLETLQAEKPKEYEKLMADHRKAYNL